MDSFFRIVLTSALVFSIDLPLSTAAESNEFAMSFLADEAPDADIADVVKGDTLSSDADPLGVVIVNVDMIGVRLGVSADAGPGEEVSELVPVRTTLDLFGEPLDLLFYQPREDSPTLDESLNLYNYPASVNYGEGYANFTFNAEGSMFVATIKTQSNNYRLLSRDVDGGRAEVAVFLLPNETDHSSEVKVLDSSEKVSEGYTLEQLEAENARYNLISDLKPKSSRFSRVNGGVYFNMLRGDLGVWDPRVAREDLSGEISSVLTRLRAISGVSGGEVFEDVDVRGSNSEGYTVYFTQTYAGLPIRSQSFVKVEAFTGNIVGVMASIYSTEYLDSIRDSLIFDKAVILKAASELLQEVIEQHDLRMSDLDDVTPDMYFVSGGNESIITELSYTISSGQVIVIRSDGTVRVRSGKKYAAANKLFKDTCRYVANRNPELCPSSQSPLVYKEVSVNNRVCFGGTECNATHRLVYDTFHEATVEWAVGDGSNCCASGGGNDNRIGAVIDPAPSVAGASFSFSNSIVVLPGNSSSDEEVVGHEFGHAAISGVNPSFFSAPDSIGADLQEGYADALAGLMSLRRGYDASPHILFNRTAAIDNIDMTTPRKFYEAYGNVGRARQVVGNFFHRLSQQPGISRNQQAQVLFRSIAFLSPVGGQLGNSYYDTDDFIAAVEDGSSHNTSLASAVDTVISQMDSDPISASSFRVQFRNSNCLGGFGSAEVGVGFAPGASLYYLTSSLTDSSGLPENAFSWFNNPVNPSQYYLMARLYTTYYRGLACRVNGPNPFGSGNAYACNLSGTSGTRIDSCI